MITPTPEAELTPEERARLCLAGIVNMQRVYDCTIVLAVTDQLGLDVTAELQKRGYKVMVAGVAPK